MLEKRNTLVTAPTGTGKTLSFLLPLVDSINKLEKKSKKIEAIVLAPLQELASQIVQELSTLVGKTGVKYKSIN